MHATELTLDPNTAHRRLTLGNDNRMVTNGSTVDQQCLKHIDRFGSLYQPAGNLSFYRVSRIGEPTLIHSFGITPIPTELLYPGFGFITPDAQGYLQLL
ncbi:unnamed protein product [Boreogadus saida]